MVDHAGHRGEADGAEPDDLAHALPGIDQRADGRVLRQVGVDLRLVGMVQHIHDVRAADAGRIVQPGMLEAARLKVLDPEIGPVLHLVLGAEHDGLGRAGLLAGRAQPDRDAVGAQRALVGLVVGLRHARDVEGAALDAVAAADAVLVHEIDDAVRVLHDGARRRAGLQATRILAMHAAILADQPFEVLGFRVLPFGKAHQREHVRRQVGRIVVDAEILANRLRLRVVPLDAGGLARLAADAFRHVDQLRHLGLPDGGRRDRGGRAPDQVLIAEFRGGRGDGGVGERGKHGPISSRHRRRPG